MSGVVKGISRELIGKRQTFANEAKYVFTHGEFLLMADLTRNEAEYSKRKCKQQTVLSPRRL